MTRRSVLTIAVSFFILIWAAITQDISSALDWRSFPEQNKAFVDKISKRFGLGHCSGDIPSSLDISNKNISTCFMSSELSGERVFHGADRNKDFAYLFYTCRIGNIYGEVTYVFYRSSSYYQCTYKIAASSKSNGQLDVGIIAASPPDPTFLVWLTARLLTFWEGVS